MSLTSRLLPKAYEAEGAIVKHRFVKPATTDPQMILQSAAATDKTIGIAQNSRDAAAVAAGKIAVTVDMLGESDLEVGAVVAQGDFLVPNASGKGIVAAPGAGVNNRYGAIALEAGSADGAIIRVLVMPGSIQG